MSDSLGKTRSRIYFVNGTLACGSHAQWYGYVRHESGCLKGNERPLSMAAIAIGGFVGDPEDDATFHFCNDEQSTGRPMYSETWVGLT